MNDQKVLEVLAGAPKLRRVQIADKLDATTDDVQAILSGLMAVGDIVETDGDGPNGLPTKFYELSPAFRRSAAFKPLEAKAAAANFPATPGATRVERAIAFIRARGAGGSATSAELHALLGLEASEYVSTVLASAIRTSRLVKDGKVWTIGAGPGSAPTPRVVRDDDELPAQTESRMEAIAEAARAAQDRAAAGSIEKLASVASAALTASGVPADLAADMIASAGKPSQTVGYRMPPTVIDGVPANESIEIRHGVFERVETVSGLASGIRAGTHGTRFANAPPADSPLGQAMAAAMGDGLPAQQDPQAPEPVVLEYPESKFADKVAGLMAEVDPVDVSKQAGAIMDIIAADARSSFLGGASSQVHPSSALPSAPAGAAAHSMAQGQTVQRGSDDGLPLEPPRLKDENALPYVDDELTPFSSDLNLDQNPATKATLARFFSDAPLPELGVTVRCDLRDPQAVDRRGQDPAAVAVAPLRFGVWSDGFVELQRAGNTVAVLTRADADALADHMIALRGGAK